MSPPTTTVATTAATRPATTGASRPTGADRTSSSRPSSSAARRCRVTVSSAMIATGIMSQSPSSLAVIAPTV